MASSPPAYASTDSDSSPAAASASSPLPLQPGATAAFNARPSQRERERRSRLNRIHKYEKMQARVAALERTALALRVAPDADTIWDEFLDDDTKQTRANVRQFITVSNEVKRLTGEKTQLQLLLTEHELARRAIARMVEAMETVDTWDASCAQWKALSRTHFEPLTSSEWIKLMNVSLSEVAEYVERQDKQSSGLSFMGWRESHSCVPGEPAAQFSLDKTYRGFDLNHHIEMAWRVYTEPELHSKIILGGGVRLSLDILQKISPTAWVFRIAFTYDETAVIVHELYLLFRIKTDNGAVLFARSIEATDLQRAINGPSDLWASNCSWMRWEVLDPTKDWASTDYRMSVGGQLNVGDPAFLSRWIFELVAIVVRSESVVAERLMLDFSW